MRKVRHSSKVAKATAVGSSLAVLKKGEELRVSSRFSGRVKDKGFTCIAYGLGLHSGPCALVCEVNSPLRLGWQWVSSCVSSTHLHQKSRCSLDNEAVACHGISNSPKQPMHRQGIRQSIVSEGKGHSNLVWRIVCGLREQLKC